MKDWKDCARYFRDLKRESAWAFALPIAAAVGVVTVAEFAREAEVSESSVRRYLKGWEKAAAAGVVPASSTLTPADVAGFVLPEQPFSDFYNTMAEGLYPKRVERAIEMHGAEKIVSRLSPEIRQDLVAELLKTASPAERLAATTEIAHAAAADHRKRPPHPADDDRATLTYGARNHGYEADTELLLALRRIKSALEHLRRANLTPSEQVAIAARVAKIRAAADLVLFATGNADVVDWDAELAKLGAEA